MSLREHPLYSTWYNMLKRCYDPGSTNWPRYGAKGIRVSPRWWDFRTFLDDMGWERDRRMTLDRIDGADDYRPGNCRWATRSEQNLNRAVRAEWAGVVKKRKRYYGMIRINKKDVRLGHYDSPEEAHLAYLMAKELFKV